MSRHPLVNCIQRDKSAGLLCRFDLPLPEICVIDLKCSNTFLTMAACEWRFSRRQRLHQGEYDLTHLLTFFLGLFIGHWLSIGRDRRRERNEIADRIYIALDEEESDPTPQNKPANDTDFKLLMRRMSWLESRKFGKKLAVYRNSKSEDNCTVDDYGNASYNDGQKVIDAIQQLKRLLHRK